ncbi:hypothetical protein CTI12_AA044340 [Artemisia annua]|uniref:Uncharacterized protein n=1 Tax=Artemisia annua TaxID=35608 RepID=A0A2U1QD85_ARTAN|nr:hypothetical protein CTI12_AA044340 [Artemisia annua]
MPPTDHHGSFLNRISIRRNQITSMDFKAVLIINRDASCFSKAPLDRLLPDHLDRTVKALDICNAITHGIELVRHWSRLAQIAVDALEQRPIVEGHVRRAKRALNTLLTSMMVDEKENSQLVGKSAERMWSIGRRGAAGPTTVNHNQKFMTRSFSTCVSKSWSASKQIQAMSTNLVAPRGGEPTGLALPVYIMSSILIQVIEKVASSLVEFADGFEFPVGDEKADEVAGQVAELADICRKMEDGLGPLQLQVRELFHRMVRSRAEKKNEKMSRSYGRTKPIPRKMLETTWIPTKKRSLWTFIVVDFECKMDNYVLAICVYMAETTMGDTTNNIAVSNI